MALDPTKIRVAAGRLYANVTAPAAFTPLALTAGVPATGTEMGLTQGESVFTYEVTYDEELADQVLSPVAVFATQEQMQLEFTLLEYAAANLQDALQQVKLTSNEGTAPKTDTFTFGTTSPTGAAVALQSIVLVSSIPGTNPQRYTIVMLYQAYQQAPSVMRYTREGSTIMKCTFRAMPLMSRSDQDLLGQVVIERN